MISVSQQSRISDSDTYKGRSYRRDFSRFSRFVSRYGGVLSQFVNFNIPGKINICINISRPSIKGNYFWAPGTELGVLLGGAVKNT